MGKVSKNTVSFGSTDNPYLQQRPQEELDYPDSKADSQERLTPSKKDERRINKD